VRDIAAFFEGVFWIEGFPQYWFNAENVKALTNSAMFNA
jgi:hypothetical protein